MALLGPEVISPTFVLNDTNILLDTEGAESSLNSEDISDPSKPAEQSDISQITIETSRLLPIESSSPNKSKKDYDEDRRKVPKSSENGRLPAEYHEEAELDLHEKQTWLEQDVEALR
mgnify:CR=1 FL=1